MDIWRQIWIAGDRFGHNPKGLQHPPLVRTAHPWDTRSCRATTMLRGLFNSRCALWSKATPAQPGCKHHHHDAIHHISQEQTLNPGFGAGKSSPQLGRRMCGEGNGTEHPKTRAPCPAQPRGIYLAARFLYDSDPLTWALLPLIVDFLSALPAEAGGPGCERGSWSCPRASPGGGKKPSMDPRLGYLCRSAALAHVPGCSY